ncbi:MAG: zinc ribbon domain-containing protein [Pseudomonadota bacterium]
MPVYEYECEATGEVITVHHPMDVVIRNWGELCFAANHPLGEIDFETPVRKMISAPAIAVEVGNAELKSKGFTKLVKRDDGVYENVTAGDKEKRYMKAGDKSSLPHFHKKVGD